MMSTLPVAQWENFKNEETKAIVTTYLGNVEEHPMFDMMQYLQSMPCLKLHLINLAKKCCTPSTRNYPKLKKVNSKDELLTEPLFITYNHDQSGHDKIPISK